MVRQRLKWALWLCVATALPWSGQEAGGDTYTVWTALDTIDVTFPADNSEVWVAGSDHQVTCTTVTDTDCNVTTEQTVGDSVTHYWTGTGTFKNNDNVGTSVTYICTNAAGNNTITAFGDDDYAPEGNAALANDAAVQKARTVTVIIPLVDTLAFSGRHTITDEEGTPLPSPQYVHSPGRNGPTAYNIGPSEDVTVAAKFWHGTSLTASSSVQVYGSPSASQLTDTSTASGSFGTNWPTGAFTCIGEVTGTAVAELTYSETFYYRVPSGSNTWIAMAAVTDRLMFLTLAAPLAAQPEACFEMSTQACAGLGAGATDADVCDAVMAAMAGPLGYQYDAASGNCHYMSSDFTHLIGIQGVGATQQKWAIDGGGAPWDPNEATRMKTHLISTLGNNPLVFEWGFHWWVFAGGSERDPSAGTSPAGTWGNYEDNLFADYRLWDSNLTAHVWHGSNSNGQGTEQGSWKVTYSNPGVAHPRFIGPPTPWP